MCRMVWKPGMICSLMKGHQWDEMSLRLAWNHSISCCLFYPKSKLCLRWSFSLPCYHRIMNYQNVCGNEKKQMVHGLGILLTNNISPFPFSYTWIRKVCSTDRIDWSRDFILTLASSLEARFNRSLKFCVCLFALHSERKQLFFGMQLSRFWPLCIYDEHGQKFHWSRTGLKRLRGELCTRIMYWSTIHYMHYKPDCCSMAHLESFTAHFLNHL